MQCAKSIEMLSVLCNGNLFSALVNCIRMAHAAHKMIFAFDVTVGNHNLREDNEVM